MLIHALRSSGACKMVVSVVRSTRHCYLEAWKTSLPTTQSLYFDELFLTARRPLVTVCPPPLTKLLSNTSAILSQALASAPTLHRRKNRCTNRGSCLGKRLLLHRGLLRGKSSALFCPRRRTRCGVSMSYFPETP